MKPSFLKEHFDIKVKIYQWKEEILRLQHLYLGWVFHRELIAETLPTWKKRLFLLTPHAIYIFRYPKVRN